MFILPTDLILSIAQSDQKILISTKLSLVLFINSRRIFHEVRYFFQAQRGSFRYYPSLNENPHRYDTILTVSNNSSSYYRLR